MRLRQFCPRGSRPGFGAGGFGAGGFGAGVTELEGHWCLKVANLGMLVFSSGLMVLLHLRVSTGGFRRALPDGVRSLECDPLEWDYLRLNPLENPLRVDLRPFPPRGCLLLVLRMS